MEDKPFNQFFFFFFIKYRAVLVNAACFSVFLLCVFWVVRITHQAENSKLDYN